MPMRIRRRAKSASVAEDDGRQVRLNPGDRLVYRGLEIDTSLLDAILDTDTRLLWAFEADGKGGVTVSPFSEEHCIWLSADDVATPEEIEI
jgi:hypothetical protein